MIKKFKLIILVLSGVSLLLAAGFNPAAGPASAANSQPAPVVTFYDPDGVVGDNYGYSVALSADGSTALVGADGASESGIADVGKAYIYTRNQGTWLMSPTATFIDPGLQHLDAFGGILALSADGGTALIGTATGAVYIYCRSSSGWSSSPSAVLNDPDASNSGLLGDDFGSALAISAGGDTALVGVDGAAVNGVSGAGKVYVFAQSNGVWSLTPVAVFTDPGSVKDDRFGISVALSSDGTVALVGTASLSNPGRGFVFNKSGNSWNSTPVATFNLPGTSDQLFGSVALSANGQVALISSGNADGGYGAVYVYALASGIWPAAPSSVFDGPPGQALFGFGGVTLSGSGLIAAVPSGDVYIYTQTGGSWLTQPITVLTAEPPVANFCGGYAFAGVGMSSDGSEALIGAPEMPSGVISPSPCSPSQVDGAVGRAYIYETSTNWISPTPPVSPGGNSGGSGGGSFGWVTVILIFGLAALHCKLRGGRAGQ